MQAINTTASLVYLNVRSHAGEARVVEHEFTSGLNLKLQSNDPRLLIALGEISGSQRPLNVQRVSRAGTLLILWLSDQEWLVIPRCDRRSDLEQALYLEFGDQICLELIPDGTFQALLSDAAWQQVTHDLQDNHHRAGICIHPWTRLCTYDLLISQADARQLHEWLQPRN